MRMATVRILAPAACSRRTKPSSGASTSAAATCSCRCAFIIFADREIQSCRARERETPKEGAGAGKHPEKEKESTCGRVSLFWHQTQKNRSMDEKQRHKGTLPYLETHSPSIDELALLCYYFVGSLWRLLPTRVNDITREGDEE